MHILHGLEEIAPFCGGIVSIGNFDGVHRGHREILAALKATANRKNCSAVVMTFDPPPVALIAPERVPPRLSTVERKAELMGKLGIDALLAFPTNRDFLNLTADQFFTKIILNNLQAQGIVEGTNFFYGKNRDGDIDHLRRMSDRHKVELQIVSPVTGTGSAISSTRIRKLISEGDLTTATQLLGHSYQIQGVVRSGAKRGRTLGYPTANLTDIPTLLPKPGVYAGICHLNGRQVPAAVHIGPNPTFRDQEFKVEAHLLDFEGDLYKKNLAVELIAQVREIVQFDNAAALKLQLEKDIRRVRELAASDLLSDSRN